LDLRLVTPADGYVLMLQVVDGEARVMFPDRPGASAALRGGEFNLEQLGARIPYANGRQGGEIVAIWSETPIRTEEFVRYGHWAISTLNRREFREDPTAATIRLATRLGASSGTAASVEYGGGDLVPRDTLRAGTYRGDGESYEWKVYRNLVRIQAGCPVGSRNATGSGEREYCASTPDRLRRSPRPASDELVRQLPPPSLSASARTAMRPAPPPVSRPVSPPPGERRPPRPPL
jgi:hypothetical protein